MFKISFDFYEGSEVVTNIKVMNIPNKYDDIDLSVVELSNNKLIISPRAMELMSTKYGDRISVNYVQVNNEITFPVIGKAETFASHDAGNRITKINTVSFKGVQSSILSKYGTLFQLELWKSGIFKMNPINEGDLATANVNLINENNDLNLI